MNNGVVNLSEAEYFSYLNFTKNLDGGERGSIFPYNKNNVLKLWDISNDENLLAQFRENVKDLVNYKSYRELLKAQRLVLVNNVIVGYIMPYFKGLNLKDIKDESSYKALLSAIKRLEKILINISYDHLQLDDLHDKNIMYHEKMHHGILAVTDCDGWTFENFKKQDSILKENISLVGKTLVDSLLRDNENLMIFINQYAKFRSYLDKIDYKMSVDFYNFFKELTNELEKYTNQKINTVGDLKLILK